jgi:hypothetical protein
MAKPKKPVGRLILLTNTFHQTSYCVRLPENGILSCHQIRRVRRWLCGVTDCRCGQTCLKTRGPQCQEAIIEPWGPDMKLVKVTVLTDPIDMPHCSKCCEYLHPVYWDHPLADRFNQYLGEHLIWEPEKFGLGYAWEEAIPPEEQWPAVVVKVNDQLREFDQRQRTIESRFATVANGNAVPPSERHAYVP